MGEAKSLEKQKSVSDIKLIQLVELVNFHIYMNSRLIEL